jgi:hypothetical protein
VSIESTQTRILGSTFVFNADGTYCVMGPVVRTQLDQQL